MSNCLEISEAVIRELRRPEFVADYNGDDFTPTSEFLHLINKAHLHLDRKHAYENRETQTRVSLPQGAWSMAAPAGLGYIKRIDLEDSAGNIVPLTGLRRSTVAWLRDMYGVLFGGVSEGEPTYFARNQGLVSAAPLINGGFTSELANWTVSGEPTAAAGKVSFLSSSSRQRDIIQQILGEVNPSGTEVSITIASMGADGQFSISFGLTNNGQLPATHVLTNGRTTAGAYTVTVPGDFDFIQIDYQDNEQGTSTCVVSEVGVGLDGIENPSFDDEIDGWTVHQGEPTTPTGGQVVFHAWAPDGGAQQIIYQSLGSTYAEGQEVTVNVSVLPEDGIFIFLAGDSLDGDDPFIYQITTAGVHTFTVTQPFSLLALTYYGPWNTSGVLDSVSVGEYIADLLPTDIITMPPADKDYTAVIHHSQYAQAMASNTDESWWSTNSPDILELSIKRQIARDINRNQTEVGEYDTDIEAALDDLSTDASKEEHSGPLVTMRLGWRPK